MAHNPETSMAQNPEARREIAAYRLAEADELIFDGRVDELFWTRIPPASGFRMQEPREGAEASERREVRIAYDSRNLYIGAILYDRHDAAHTPVRARGGHSPSL